VEDKLRVSGSCVIGLDELEWRFTPSGGPGGQHANKASTRVEVRFDVEASPSLGPRQRERLLDKLGPVVRIVADDERSQLRNRTVALERLRTRLAEGLHVDKPRRATAPSKSAEQRRLEAKKRRSSTKRDRAWRPGNES
jgi:ribosome-associated protein